MIIYLICICVFVPIFVQTTDELKTVETSTGPVRGKSQVTIFENRQYFAFKGIPYAEVPVKNLRFKVRS